MLNGNFMLLFLQMSLSIELQDANSQVPGKEIVFENTGTCCVLVVALHLLSQRQWFSTFLHSIYIPIGDFILDRIDS